MELTGAERAMGTQICDIDLASALDELEIRAIERSLGRHGVLCFPKQRLEPIDLKRFAQRFGTLEINVANTQASDLPEVMTLSNIVKDGQFIGLNDAGQDWHTDMSYSRDIAFCNILYGIEIPMREGEPLGCTEFSDMHAAYRDLPAALKRRLEGMTVLHDFNKFWENMRTRPGSRRQPLTSAQRAAKPPVSHPIFLRHPLTGENVLYANPGYAIRINQLGREESDAVLADLFAHQLQPQYRYRHRWSPGDVLMWDNIGTIHNAVADYAPHERRLIKRCQVMADRLFPHGTA